jgi:hypothetical protein
MIAVHGKARQNRDHLLTVLQPDRQPAIDAAIVCDLDEHADDMRQIVHPGAVI